VVLLLAMFQALAAVIAATGVAGAPHPTASAGRSRPHTVVPRLNTMAWSVAQKRA